MYLCVCMCRYYTSVHVVCEYKSIYVYMCTYKMGFFDQELLTLFFVFSLEKNKAMVCNQETLG